MPSHREMTRRRTLRRQGAAVALVALAGAGIALPISGALGPGEQIVTEPTQNVAGAIASVMPPAAPVDVSPYVTILATLAPPPPPPPAPVPEETEVVAASEPVEETVEAPPAAPMGKLDKWVYLGWIVGPRAKHALVRVDSRQLMLPENGQHDGVTVQKVEQDHIMISDGSQEKRVDLLKPVALWTQAPAATPTIRPTAGTPNGAAPPMNKQAAALRAEMAARMAMKNKGMSRGEDRKELPALAIDPRMQEEYAKRLQDGELSDEDRIRLLEELGMDSGFSPAQRARMLNNAGLPFAVDPVVRNAMENSGISADTDPEKAMSQLESVEGGGR